MHMTHSLAKYKISFSRLFLNLFSQLGMSDKTSLTSLFTSSGQGLTGVVFSDQPSLSLVSNGAECIVINKKFYLEHATEETLRGLRKEVSQSRCRPAALLFE